MAHRMPFSSPPPGLAGRTGFDFDAELCPSWAPSALWNTAPDSSPFRAIGSIVKNRDELTKSSERVLKHSALALITDGQLPWLMDVQEARSTLKVVAAKTQTRAAKRKAEAVVASVSERIASEKIGAARKAFSAKVAARMPKAHRVVRMTGRVDVF